MDDEAMVDVGAMIDDGVMVDDGWSNNGNGAMMIEDR
jgi:hypothetical protein